jgi:hypothetical protein
MSRRSTRARAQPQSLADEQVTHRYHAQELADLRRAMQLSLQSDSCSESEEEAVADGEASASEEEEENKENIPPHSPWVEGTHAITLPPFALDAGSVLPRHRAMTEMGYLQCFLTPELVSTIATNTNLYAASKQAPAGWATTPEEMWLFIAVHIFMGIVVLPAMATYWEEGWRQEYVVKAFSRTRFKELQRYFHIAEPTPAGVQHTVIDKIRPLHDACRRIFNRSFIPPRDMTVDETMVRFKGRSKLKTVIRNKPTPIGYKVYTLASHGYLLNFNVYMGKGGYRSKQGVIHHAVMKLVPQWAREHRILYLDNLYTSPALCRHLLNIGIRSCGTFRPNRSGLPSGLSTAMKELQQGQTKAWQSDQLGCLVWCDKRPVLMLTTHHKVDDMTTFEQDRGPNRPKSVTKPKVVLDYNQGKCHVDTVDQLRQYYAIQRKSYKNWPPLAWWLVDMCIINAYTLWRLDTKAKMTQLDFRRELLRQLAAAYPPPAIHAHHTVPPRHSLADEGHWPKHSHVARQCKHCGKGRAGRKRSEVICKQCGVHLCLEPCFELYHRQG